MSQPIYDRLVAVTSDYQLPPAVRDQLKGETGSVGPTGPYGGTSVTDPQVASYVTGDTATRAALEESTAQIVEPATAMALAGHTAVSEASAARVTDPRARFRLTPDGRRRVTLISGQEDQTIAVLNATSTPDTVRTVEGTQAVRVTTTGAATASISHNPATALAFGAASLVRALIWLDEPVDIASITVSIRTSLDPVVQWVRSDATTGAPLRRGWNLLSWKAAEGTTTTWGQTLRTQVAVVTNRATAFTLQSVWVEAVAKAQILYIEDRGYQTFVDHGLPALRARGIPVTWALDPMLHGTGTGKAAVVTDAQIAQFYADGDDLSIHAFAGEITATMTGEQIREDSLKSHQWLQDRGYRRGREWRAAWTQNSAPAHAAAQPYYVAYATPTSNASLESWPFTDPWNVHRWSVHGRTEAVMDAMFTTLERTHGLLVCYTHGVHVDGGSDVTPAMWAYFIAKIDEGLTGGWLEGVTFSQLLEQSGGAML